MAREWALADDAARRYGQPIKSTTEIDWKGTTLHILGEAADHFRSKTQVFW